jgi:hypothetical protein
MKFLSHDQYRRKRARDLEDQAHHMQEAGQFVGVLPISQQAFVLYQELQDEDGLARIYNLQGNIYA